MTIPFQNVKFYVNNNINHIKYADAQGTWKKLTFFPFLFSFLTTCDMSNGPFSVFFTFSVVYRVCGHLSLMLVSFANDKIPRDIKYLRVRTGVEMRLEPDQSIMHVTLSFNLLS